MQTVTRKRSRRQLSRPAITEARLRKIIQEELTRQYLIEEGLWDDVKGGVAKLAKTVKDKIKSKAKEWAAAISDVIAKTKKMPEELVTLMGAIKEGMKESGESIPLNDTLKKAKELSQVNYDSLLDSQLKGPMKDAASEAAAGSKTERLERLHGILFSEEYNLNRRRQINESVGVTTVLGLTFAAMSVVPVLCKGLYKIADWMGLPDLAQKFEDWSEASHHLEQKVIDVVVPDRLSYAVYKALQKTPMKKGLMIGEREEIVSFEEYTSGKAKAFKSEEEKGKEAWAAAEKEYRQEKRKEMGGKGPKEKHGGHGDAGSIRSKVDNLIFKGILAYFLFMGIQGVMHAGASLLGILEGGASTVKGVEIGGAAAEVAALVRSTAAAAAKAV